MSGPTTFVLRAVNEDPKQMLRLMRFREKHPEVEIGVGPGFWQGQIPASNGGTVITRFVLEELLDKLEELLAPGNHGPSAKSDR
jgi:hypothetical protein